MLHQLRNLEAVLSLGGGDAGVNDGGEERSVRFAVNDSTIPGETTSTSDSGIMRLPSSTDASADMPCTFPQRRHRQQLQTFCMDGESDKSSGAASRISAEVNGSDIARNSIEMSGGIDDIDMRQEDPFKINIPGPCSGPVKPASKPKFLSSITGQTTVKRVLRSRNVMCHSKRYTQFHSLLAPIACFEVMKSVLAKYGCTQIISKESRSAQGTYRIKCVAVKDKQPTVTSIEIARVDGDLTTISFKKKCSVDSKRFNSIYHDIFKLFCRQDESSVVTASDDRTDAGTSSPNRKGDRNASIAD
jgi:hypothetical protein